MSNIQKTITLVTQSPPSAEHKVGKVSHGFLVCGLHWAAALGDSAGGTGIPEDLHTNTVNIIQQTVTVPSDGVIVPRILKGMSFSN